MASACCHRAALELTASWCDECGQALLRCQAFAECGGLIDERGKCPVCVSPELTVDAGGVFEAKVGAALSVPLVLANASRVARPLFLKGLWTREAEGDWAPVEVPWERLEAGAKAPLSVRAKALKRAGVHQIEVLLALGTRWRWREEVLAFSTGLALTVEQNEALTVQQNIHYGGDQSAAGGTVYAPVRVNLGGEPSASRESKQPRVLTLVRASNLERTFELRGYGDGTTVSRQAHFRWKGFAAEEAPPDGPIATADGLLTLGRSRAVAAGGTNSVRLLARDVKGAVDEEASRAISRQHFSLCISNGRVVLRVESELGAFLNGKPVPRGAVIHLRDKDRFSPIARSKGRLAVGIAFEINHGVVETVTLTRT